MEKEIIDNIDVMVDDLKLIQDTIKEGNDINSIDPLDLLAFIAVGLDFLYEAVKEHYHLSDEE